MTRTLTNGSVLKNILIFSLPYCLSYLLQTLYGMADLFIIGQFNGVASTTGVSIGAQVLHMVTVMIVGLSMGTTIMLGLAVGGQDTGKAAKIVGNTVTLFFCLAVAATFILTMLADSIVTLMSTPEAAVSETKNYLAICFAGIPFIILYNIISSIFRGMGDSKSPMYFILIACIINIVLDYILIGFMKMGSAGAALGTTLSQTASVIISLIVIFRKNMGILLKLSDLKPDKEILLNLLKTGIPVSLQDGFIQVSFIIITVIANRMGLNEAAAVGIVEKIIGIMFLIPSSMLSTVSAVSAQNIGAGKPDRARSTLFYSMAISVGWGLVISISVQFYSGTLVGLFSNDISVIALGGGYLKSYIWDCMIAGIHFCFSGYFFACRLSIVSFIHNVASIVFARVPIAYAMSLLFPDTLFPMGIAAPVGSCLSVLICLFVYYVYLPKNIYGNAD